MDIQTLVKIVALAYAGIIIFNAFCLFVIISEIRKRTRV